MFIAAPLLHQAARQSATRPRLRGCVPVVRTASLQSARSYHPQAFRASPVHLERQSRLFKRSDFPHPRSPPSFPPDQRLRSQPTASPPPSQQQYQSPEELYPESFPLDEKDLVNPSGRIYAVRRPPHEEREEDAIRRMDEIHRETHGEARKPSILRPIIFLGLSGSLIFYSAAYASVKQSNDAAEKVLESSNGGIFGDFSSFFGISGNADPDRLRDPRRYESVSESKMRAARKQELAERLGWRLNWVLGWCDRLGITGEGKQFVGRMYTWGAETYLNLPDARSCVLPVIATNAAIFLAWQLSRGRFMARHFIHVPASGRQYTHFTSTFSHKGLFHFAVNNFALWTFGAGALLTSNFYFGKSGEGKHTPEASLTPHFLAFFATAGVFSSVVAHLLTALSYRAVALRAGTSMVRSHIGRVGSLGASGAVYSTVVATALANPDARVGVLFLPGFSLPIQDAVKLLVCLDFIGMFVPFSPLGHSAHLGGALFGYLYYYHGSQIWEACKAQIRRAEQQRLITALSL